MMKKTSSNQPCERDNDCKMVRFLSISVQLYRALTGLTIIQPRLSFYSVL